MEYSPLHSTSIHTYIPTYITLDTGVSGSAERSRLPFNNHYLAEAFIQSNFTYKDNPSWSDLGLAALFKDVEVMSVNSLFVLSLEMLPFL